MKLLFMVVLITLLSTANAFDSLEAATGLGVKDLITEKSVYHSLLVLLRDPSKKSVLDEVVHQNPNQYKYLNQLWLSGTSNTLCNWSFYRIGITGEGQTLNALTTIYKKLGFNIEFKDSNQLSDVVSKFADNGVIVWPEVERRISQSAYDIGPFNDKTPPPAKKHYTPQKIGSANNKAKVYVLDTQGTIVYGDANSPSNTQSGTHGLIIQSIIQTIAGGSRVYNLAVCGNDGKCLDSRIIQGICFAKMNAANDKEKLIINLSLGRKMPSPMLYEFLKLPDLVIVAAGNTDKSRKDSNRNVFPARYFDTLRNLVSVSAMQKNGKSWEAADFIEPGGHIEIFAPGRWITNPYTSYASGTSYATAIITGLGATLERIDKDQLIKCLQKQSPLMIPQKPGQQSLPAFNPIANYGSC